MCSFGSEMSDPLGGCTTDPVSCNCTHTSVLYTSSRTDPRGLQIPKPEGLVWGLGDIEVGYLQQNSHEERVKVPSLMAPATLSFFFSANVNSSFQIDLFQSSRDIKVFLLKT